MPRGTHTPITDVLGDLRDSYELAGRSTHTVSMLARAVDGLTTSLREAKRPQTIEDLRREDIVQFLGREKRRGQSPASLSITQRSLKTFLRFAVESGYIKADPSKGVPGVRVNPVPVRFLDDAQMEHLLRTVEADTTFTGARDAAWLGLLADTGIRRGELLGMTPDSVDLNLRTATITAESSKVRRPKVVAFSPRTSKALRRYLRLRTAYMTRTGMTGDYLWVGAKRQPLLGNGLLQALHRRLEQAELPKVSVHSLRHRWAATAVRDGLQMPYLLYLGGWSSPAMVTSRYGSFTVAQEALSAAQARFGKARP